MIDVMFSALWAMLSSPQTMGLMLIAVLLGLVVGVTPGIGGRLSIALAGDRLSQSAGTCLCPISMKYGASALRPR